MTTTGSYTEVPGDRPSDGAVKNLTVVETPSRPAIDPEAISITQIGLPKDVVVALSEAEIATVADLMAADLSQMLQIEGVGRGSIRRIRLWLASRGLLDAVPPVATINPPRRGPARSISRRRVEIPALPSGLENAPVPLNILPARVANLLRKHHLVSLGRLHSVLSGIARFDGFGAGTRQTAIEMLPQMYKVASMPNAAREVPATESRSISAAVASLRAEVRRPIRIEQLASTMEIPLDIARKQAAEADDILFISPWCFQPDLQGLVDAGQTVAAGSVGEWIVAALAKTLNPIEHEVLVRWIGLNKPPERHAEIARALNRSRERVRQLRERALLKVANSHALAGVLLVLGRSISSKSESRFIANFTIRHAVLLGPTVTPGLARLAVKIRG